MAPFTRYPFPLDSGQHTPIFFVRCLWLVRNQGEMTKLISQPGGKRWPFAFFLALCGNIFQEKASRRNSSPEEESSGMIKRTHHLLFSLRTMPTALCKLKYRPKKLALWCVMTVQSWLLKSLTLKYMLNQDINLVCYLHQEWNLRLRGLLGVNSIVMAPKSLIARSFSFQDHFLSFTV